MSYQNFDPGFPSHPHYLSLRAKLRTAHSLDGLTDEERLQWHAYDYAWRIVFKHSSTSPIDPQRQYYSPRMVEDALRCLAAHFGMRTPYRALPKPTQPTTVRSNWRQIQRSDLSEAELALAMEHRDETIRRLHSELPPRMAHATQKIVGNPFVPEACDIYAPAQPEVRGNWRQIPFQHLTGIERELFREDIDKDKRRLWEENPRRAAAFDRRMTDFFADAREDLAHRPETFDDIREILAEIRETVDGSRDTLVDLREEPELPDLPGDI